MTKDESASRFFCESISISFDDYCLFEMKNIVHETNIVILRSDVYVIIYNSCVISKHSE